MRPDLFSGVFNVARNPVNKSPRSLGVPVACVSVKHRHILVTRSSRACRMGWVAGNNNMLWFGPMTLLRLSASGSSAAPVGPRALGDALEHALSELPPGAPVVIMIHGYKFSPRSYRHTPHRHILALRTSKRAPRLISWPRHMRMANGPENGLVVAFAWHARGSVWRAHDRAPAAAQALADVIKRIKARRNGPLDIMAHSLGARVALSALEQSDANSINRIILMSGAVFRSDAQRALDSPAGQTAEVINTTSPENWLFDHLFANLVRPFAFWDTPISAGLRKSRRNWLDIAVSDPATCIALAQLGFRIGLPRKRICHWTGYLRPGLFPLYRALLQNRESWPLHRLREALPVQCPTIAFEQGLNSINTRRPTTVVGV